MSSNLKIPRERAKEILAGIDAGTSPIAPHLQPIMEIVACGGADLIIVAQTREKFRAKRKQSVILVGDDFSMSLGPDAFDKISLRRAIKDASGIAIISAAPEARVYAAAAIGAALGRPFILIETRMRHELEWIRLVQEHNRGAPLLVVTEKQPVQ